MPDHEHDDLDRWHDRTDDQTLHEHLEQVHGCVSLASDVNLAVVKRVHFLRHTDPDAADLVVWP